MSGTSQRVIGASLPRKEDDRLLRGDGRFTDDVQLAHQLEMAVGRCPFPHAAIGAIDISRAQALAGVKHILTGPEVRELSDPLTVLRPVPGAPDLPFYALAQERALHEGQPVVSVVATSRAVAEDALEVIDIDYEPLPHLSGTLDTLAENAPVLHSDVMKSNLLSAHEDRMGEPEARMADAEMIAEGRFYINRVSALPMETRGIVAVWRPAARELLIYAATQTPHLVRQQFAESLRLDESAIRVVASDVGGGFGMKLGVNPEELLAALHAMALRHPVKWTEDRLEFFRASNQARESVFDYRIGAEADGRIAAITTQYTTDLGAWNSTYGSAQLSSVTFTGPYKVPDAMVERRVAITNKTPIGAYRGYGQPEVNFAREVMLDRLARRLGIDPFDIREKNMLRPEDLPWKTASRAVYENGDYLQTLRMAAEAVDYGAHRAAPRQARGDGRMTGIGLSSFVERTGYASARFLAGRGSRFGAHESVTLRANRSGSIDLYTGVSSFGQGSETVFAQICAEVLGVDYDAIHIHAGDTAASPLNTGAFASRTLIAGAGAIREAAESLRGKILRIAAWVLECEPDALVINGDLVRFREGSNQNVPVSDIFFRAIIGQGIPEGETPGLEASAHFEPTDASFSYGTAAAVVSVDPKSGEFTVERFVMAHDCGVQVNPLLVEGQVRGGLVQGFGAALAEDLQYDPGTGQLTSGSMLDYFAPTAADVPPIELLHSEIPTPVTT
ncbi:MAG: xanthine dehydrogenase family protein, partial [Rhodospirillaceae bacterium]|nr:xanthine dehydrogenase family protein [Rhodospirillaceae bacterium]